MSKTHLSVYTNPSEKRSNRNSSQKHNLIFPKNFESILKKVCVCVRVCAYLHLCPARVFGRRDGPFIGEEVSVGATSPGTPGRPLRLGAERGLPGRGSRAGRPGGSCKRHQEGPTCAGAHDQGAPEGRTARVRGPSPTPRGPLRHKLPRPGVPS